ncbi:hypothetical protein REIS_1668 [Rickettsia endosymbiont of Ixodes scapularis]|nr:hypothetical protein REIS_1668 [Rickettsia endosymbiont of Ixodes scapularis]
MVYLRRFGKWGKRLKLNNLITEKALEETSVKLLPTNTILTLYYYLVQQQ